ncbi:uncharacterized protein NPIL_83841, partial [Nephila pilipes]
KIRKRRLKSSKTDNIASKHISVEQNKIDFTVPNHVNNKVNKILLQTASVKLVRKLSSKVIRSLYDPGSLRSFFQKNLSRQTSLNKVGEEELLIHTLGSNVPTRIKCARVQVKIRDILDKDEIIIEALEIDEVTSAPLEFALIDIINELKPKGINLCDVDYGVFGKENISLLIGADHYFYINKDEDNIFCDTTVLKCSSFDLTRRNVLSIVHKMFDPLGVLSPTTLIPMLFIQRNWILKFGWDTVLPDDQ